MNVYAVECRFGWETVQAADMKEAGAKAQQEFGIFDIQKIMILIEDGKLDYGAVKDIAETEARRNAPCPQKPSRKRRHHNYLRLMRRKHH